MAGTRQPWRQSVWHEAELLYSPSHPAIARNIFAAIDRLVNLSEPR